MAMVSRMGQLRTPLHGWQLPLRKAEVSQLQFDHFVTLLFLRESTSATLRLGLPFRIELSGGPRVITPGQRASLDPVFALLWQRVELAVAGTDGSLLVGFEDGSRLVATANETYEAWEFESSLGHRLVCGPGGQPTVWSPPGTQWVATEANPSTSAHVVDLGEIRNRSKD